MTGDPITGWTDNPGLILNNGSLLRFTYSLSNCTTNTGNGLLYCGSIYVDVNGFAKPNTVGRDIFAVWVQENSIKPFGVPGCSWYGTCNTANHGYGCSTEYIMGTK